MNSVNVIGNLATDVEVRDVGEKRVAKFLLAVDRLAKEGGADFIGVSVWERQGELCAQYLTKGRRVGIEGYLRSHSWEDDQGKRRREVELVGRRVDFLSTSRDDAAGELVPFEPAAVA